MIKKISLLLFFIILCQFAGIIGSIFTIPALESWYPALTKPFFNPPSFIFGPVWTILYLLMGVSLYMVWGNKKININWFWLQLGLNMLWSVIFFGLQSPFLGFLVILLLWYTIFRTIKEFGKYNKFASYLLFPYIIWVSFAAILNFTIMILNI